MTTEITTQNKALAPGLQMIQGQKFRQELTTFEGQQRLKGQLVKLFSLQHTFNGARSADKYEPEEIALIVEQIQSMIQEKYLNLTLQELVHVCKKGMTGAYNDKVYFSAMAVRSWIEEYLKTERVKLGKELNRLRSEIHDKPKEPTEEEKEQSRIFMFKTFLDFLDREYQEWQEKPTESKRMADKINICVAPSYWYDKFIELGLMEVPNDEEKTRVYEMHIEPAKRILKEKNISLSPTVGNHASDKIKDNAIVLSKWYFVRAVVHGWFENGVDYKGLLNS
jgi:hypothetical protein